MPPTACIEFAEVCTFCVTAAKEQCQGRRIKDDFADVSNLKEINWDVTELNKSIKKATAFRKGEQIREILL